MKTTLHLFHLASFFFPCCEVGSALTCGALIKQKLPYRMSVYDVPAITDVKRLKTDIYVCSVNTTPFITQTQRHIVEVHDSLLSPVYDTDSYMLVGGPLDEIRHRPHFMSVQPLYGM